jgi:hypothetical protein
LSACAPPYERAYPALAPTRQSRRLRAPAPRPPSWWTASTSQDGPRRQAPRADWTSPRRSRSCRLCLGRCIARQPGATDAAADMCAPVGPSRRARPSQVSWHRCPALSDCCVGPWRKAHRSHGTTRHSVPRPSLKGASAPLLEEERDPRIHTPVGGGQGAHPPSSPPHIGNPSPRRTGHPRPGRKRRRLPRRRSVGCISAFRR